MNNNEYFSVISIRGKDYTNILNCIVDCYVTKRRPSKAFNSFCEKMYCDCNTGRFYNPGKLRRVFFIDFLETYKSIITGLRDKKKLIEKKENKLDKLLQQRESEGSGDSLNKKIRDAERAVNSLKRGIPYCDLEELSISDLNEIVELVDNNIIILKSYDEIDNESVFNQFYIKPLVQRIKKQLSNPDPLCGCELLIREAIVSHERIDNFINEDIKSIFTALKKFLGDEFNRLYVEPENPKDKAEVLKTRFDTIIRFYEEYKDKEQEDAERSIKQNELLKRVDILLCKKHLPSDDNVIDEINKILPTLPEYGNKDLKKSINDFKEKIHKIVISDESIVISSLIVINSETIEKKLHEHPLIKLYQQVSRDFCTKDEERIIVGHRESDIVTKDRQYQLFNSFNGIPQFGNLVGTLKMDYIYDPIESSFRIISNDFDECVNKVSVDIRINSRFDADPRKPYFLLEMLSRGSLVFNGSEVPSDDESIFDCLMLFYLKNHLIEASKKGVYQAYHTFNENGNRPRGCIDFSRHIKLNAGLKNGNIAYSYREKSANNFLNHLILEAYYHLKNKYFEMVVANIDKEFETKKVLDILRNETHYPQYSRSVLLKKNESPITHPFYNEYEDIRQICLKVLKDEGISLIQGEGESVSGILYYIPDLWEEYLEKKMNEYAIDVDAQMPVYYFGNNETDKVYKSSSYPDFVFKTDDGIPYMMIDAKFKPGWNQVHNEGKIGDAKEDYNKCIRDMNTINAYATGTIFPCMDGVDVGSEEQEDDELSDLIVLDRNNTNRIIRHNISEYNPISSFYTIPINIPRTKVDSFNKWQKILNNELQIQFNNLTSYLDCEKDKFSVINSLIMENMNCIDAVYKANGSFEDTI